VSRDVVHADCLDALRVADAESVDAIVTDPPYALTAGKKGGSGVASFSDKTPQGRARIGTGFMGKAWDAELPTVAMWAEMLRVAKPGAHLVAFGGTRTHHRLMVAIEDAGWEIRDCLMWLYGSGFPKSLNIGDGWGTALKPGWEPIVLARKPLIGTVAVNVARFGTGALNIDGCRIGEMTAEEVARSGKSTPGMFNRGSVSWRDSDREPLGRWPANVVLDEEAGEQLDAQSGKLSSGGTPARRFADKTRNTFGAFNGEENPDGIGSSQGGASRFFYCAKASRSEREAGLEGAEKRLHGLSAAAARGDDYDNGDGGFNKTVTVRNVHPTVKPVALMRWLCRLITPPGGLILDPFTGSGSTGVAAALEGFAFLGFEREEEYVTIARQRIVAASAQTSLGLGAA